MKGDKTFTTSLTADGKASISLIIRLECKGGCKTWNKKKMIKPNNLAALDNFTSSVAFGASSPVGKPFGWHVFRFATLGGCEGLIRNSLLI
ncbi:MAG: hypothetical protein V8R06_01570 [Dialister hominis]|uniref:hypothetical protein n=1 Tax=Dialister hominis TaxID=2582419 RepID=UPI00300F6F31